MDNTSFRHWREPYMMCCPWLFVAISGLAIFIPLLFKGLIASGVLMRIEEEYKKSGYFWLPSREARKIPGTLTIEDGGKIELEIIGLFDESLEALNTDDDLNRIVGNIEEDGLVTLENCFYTSKKISFGDISKSKILVRQVLSGAAWDKDKKVTFNTLSFSVDCLDEWVGISGINVNNDWDQRTTIISYTPPEALSFSLDNGMTLEIIFAYSLPAPSTLKESKITQTAYFKISSSSLCELSEFTKIASKITTLMCFAMDETVSMKTLSATSSEIVRNIGGKKIPETIKIYYESTSYVDKEPCRNWYDMLFNFRSIENNAKEIFNNWINAYEYLFPAFGLYFSTKHDAHKYLNGKFLALMQGLETYHRRTSDETLMELDEFESLVNKVLDSCPEDNRKWLSGRLSYGNEISLRTRIKRIIEPFKKHLGTSRERDKLLMTMLDTRNYFTHYNEDLRDKSVSGRELWVLCKKMELIFNLHFLKVIGFTDDEIDGVVENSQSLQRKIKAS